MTAYFWKERGWYRGAKEKRIKGERERGRKGRKGGWNEGRKERRKNANSLTECILSYLARCYITQNS